MLQCRDGSCGAKANGRLSAVLGQDAQDGQDGGVLFIPFIPFILSNEGREPPFGTIAARRFINVR